MIYEASEGGAGVIRRLLEPGILNQVAGESLSRCHFDEDGADRIPQCIAACYECLMSISNQHEASALDRHQIREFLM